MSFCCWFVRIYLSLTFIYMWAVMVMTLHTCSFIRLLISLMLHRAEYIGIKLFRGSSQKYQALDKSQWFPVMHKEVSDRVSNSSTWSCLFLCTPFSSIHVVNKRLSHLIWCTPALRSYPRAAPNADPDHDCCVPSSHNGDLQALQHLLSEGVNLNVATTTCTPFHLAAPTPEPRHTSPS